MLSFTLVTAALAGLVAASPMRWTARGHQSAVNIAFSTANGTFSETITIAADGTIQEIKSHVPITFLFTSPPFENDQYVEVSCAYWTPNNGTLGNVTVSKPTTVPVKNAPVGYVACEIS